MEKVKNFIEKRSKLSLLVFLTSFILGILLVLELTSYSEFVRLTTTGEVNGVIEINTMLAMHNLDMSTAISVFIWSILIFICLFNFVGYLYNKSEFMFISTGLYVLLFCIGTYICDIGGLIFIACLFLLNLLGYLDQTKIVKKSKNA